VCPADPSCPTKCGVSECDHEASKMRMPWLIRGCCARGKKKTDYCIFISVNYNTHMYYYIFYVLGLKIP